MKNPPLLLFLTCTALAAAAATGLRVARAQELASAAQNAARPTSVQPWLNENGDLDYDDLTAIDPTTAKTIVDFAAKNISQFAYLSLNGLRTLDAASAAAFADFEGANLFLSGLTKLDVATARSLAQCKCGCLALNGLNTLGPDIATALAEFRGTALHLNGVATLDAEAATNLAKFKGVMLSVGVHELDAQTAKALAGFKGSQLDLNCQTVLDVDTLDALAEYPGRIDFPESVWREFTKKHPLTPQTAIAWARLCDGRFRSITAFESPDSIGIAKALTAWRGHLEFPSLKRISPKTLAVLLEKEHVEIPLIETLKLIPEPDGSVTEDFIIPDAFGERQKRQRQ